MAGHGEVKGAVLAIMKDKAGPKELWAADDILAELKGGKFTKLQISNTLIHAANAGHIFKHQTKLKHGASQFALDIPVTERYIAGMSTSNGSPMKRRKGQKATAKEIRMAFMTMQNAMAKLEDMIMPVIEDAEDKDKILNKLKNML